MFVIKLLTLNSHSLIEKNYQYKLEEFVKAVLNEKPDVIALQEVNQTTCGKVVNENLTDKYFPCMKNIVITEDNHVYNVAERLSDMGLNYSWTWLPIKCGYGKYDEGIAVMSLKPIVKAEQLLVSKLNDYTNWKTRRIIGITTDEKSDEWFYSVHYGWWDDKDEPFLKQWEKTCMHMKKHKKVWIMGDFNNSADVCDEGYDEIIRSGWYDSFNEAENKDDGMTVRKAIDGWKERGVSDGMRIDQIWCNEKPDVKYSKVVFNGNCYPVVSDHFGVMTEYKGL